MSKPVHVEVVNKGNMPIEALIKKFSRLVKEQGVIQEVRDRRYYEKPSDKRRKAKLRRAKVVKKLNEELNKVNVKGRDK